MSIFGRLLSSKLRLVWLPPIFLTENVTFSPPLPYVRQFLCELLRLDCIPARQSGLVCYQPSPEVWSVWKMPKSTFQVINYGRTHRRTDPKWRKKWKEKISFTWTETKLMVWELRTSFPFLKKAFLEICRQTDQWTVKPWRVAVLILKKIILDPHSFPSDINIFKI